MGTISEKLRHLAETKRRIKNAIIARGQSVSDSDRFVDYADKILQIETGADISVSPLDVSSNGEYDAGSGNAYNPVTVNITPNCTTLSVDENGTYKASEQNVDGFSTVTVNVSANLVEKRITAEGTYEASNDDVDGYDKIVVEIDRTGPFTVQFMNGETLLQVVNDVPYNGYAAYNGGTPEKSGKTFTGWNPQPVGIKEDTTCYAVFEEEAITTGGEIEDSWDEIAACRGAKYPIGAFKMLLIGEVGGIRCRGVRMAKVYTGEKGTVSTWVALDPLGYDTPEKMYFDTENSTDCTGWDGSALRNWLNNDLISALPSGLSGAIAPVTKYSRFFSPQYEMYELNHVTQDRIWLLSAKESGYTYSTGIQTTSGPYCETAGCDYVASLAGSGVNITMGRTWRRSTYYRTTSAGWYGYCEMANVPLSASGDRTCAVWQGDAYDGQTLPLPGKNNVQIGFCL